MSSIFGMVLLVGGVIALIRLFGVFPRALQAVHISRSAFAVMNDPHLEDDRKEVLLQAHSLSLLRRFLDILIYGTGSIAIPVGLVWMLECAGLLSLRAVLALTLSWPFLLGSGIATLVVFWRLKK